MGWRRTSLIGVALCCATGCYMHHSAPEADAQPDMVEAGGPQLDAASDSQPVDASVDSAVDAVFDATLDAVADQASPDASVDAFIPEPTAGITYFKPNRSDVPPYFGNSVALSADTLVVGAPYDNEPSDASSHPVRGAIYVYTRTASGWALQKRITRPLDGTGNNFGSDVAISGNLIVASADGSVYVLERHGDQWSPQALLLDGPSYGGIPFSRDVAISGNTVIVGAPDDSSSARGINGEEDNTNAYASGAAYIFVRNGDTWTRQAYLKASNADAMDGFGERVSISGGSVVVSARYEASSGRGVNSSQQNNNDVPGNGAAYVFVRSGDTWTQQAYLKASNAELAGSLPDQFGTSVSIHGDTLAVGAWAESSSATGINGDQNNNDTPGNGAVYVFVRSGTQWTQQAYVKASAAVSDRLFGDRVDVFNDTLVVGARNDSDPDLNGNPTWDDSGAIYLFSRSGTQWHSGARVRAPNAGPTDWFGWDISLYDTSIAVGAISEASTATGINGAQSNDDQRWVGAAYVFDRIDDLGFLR